MRTTWALLALAFVSSSTGCAAEPEEDDTATDDAAMVGDVRADGEHHEVVLLKFARPNGYATCTGTLIGAQTVITAQHCIAEGCSVTAYVDRTGGGGWSGEPYAGTRCDAYPADLQLAAARDIATIRLARPVAGISPARLSDARDFFSMRYEVFGYGRFGAAPTFGAECEKAVDGHKRKGGYSGTLGLHFGSVTCTGDSGGPHFLAGTNVIAGLTSRGVVVGVGVELNAEIAHNRDWILGRVAAYGDHPVAR